MISSAAALALILAGPPQTGNALLDDLQERAVRFFWEQSHPETGFAKDRATNADGTDDHTVASAAATGFALVSYAIGVEHNWLKKEDARRRARLTLQNVLSKWPHERGWLYHFIDWRTGARMWNSEASSIDTSILLAGMLAAERYWKDPQITRDTDAFVKRMDFKWMLTDGGRKPNERIFSMGWKPEDGFIESRWTGYSEEKMLFVQAYGADPTLPNDGWEKTNRQLQNYKGINFINGGPLFIHQMSESFYDFKGLRDRRGYNYFVATRNVTLANRKYCIDNPKKFKAYGPNFWGLSACDTPDGYQALGAPGWTEDNGTITPTSAVASLRFTPAESLAFAEAMRRDHPKAYGRYGFPNGYNPSRNWIDPDVIGIDLGMMLCGIENARTGRVMKWSSEHPIVRAGFTRAGLKKDTALGNAPLLILP